MPRLARSNALSAKATRICSVNRRGDTEFSTTESSVLKSSVGIVASTCRTAAPTDAAMLSAGNDVRTIISTVWNAHICFIGM